MTPSHPGSFIRAEVIRDLGPSVTKAAEVLGVRRDAPRDLLSNYLKLGFQSVVNVWRLSVG